MILDKIIACKKSQIKMEKKNTPIDKFLADYNGLNAKVRDFKGAIKKNKISIIAEIKKASPSKGIILEHFNAIDIGKIYEEINVDAVSILTEKNFFKGNDKYISEVKRINFKPILRKDFIIDEYQIYQSKIIGADAILLIVSILKDKLKKFYNLAQQLGMECLVEVHDEEELCMALDCGCSIIGVNNRNLKDFTVDLKTTEKLINYVPKDTIVVSESGIKTSENTRYLRDLGVNAVLIGETFMRNINDIKKLNDFIKNIKER